MTEKETVGTASRARLRDETASPHFVALVRQYGGSAEFVEALNGRAEPPDPRVLPMARTTATVLLSVAAAFYGYRVAAPAQPAVQIGTAVLAVAYAIAAQRLAAGCGRLCTVANGTWRAFLAVAMWLGVGMLGVLVGAGHPGASAVVAVLFLAAGVLAGADAWIVSAGAQAAAARVGRMFLTVVPVAAFGVVTVVIIGVAADLQHRGFLLARPGAVPSTFTSATGTAEPPSPTPTVASTPASTPDLTRPDGALDLSDQDALAALQRDADADRSALQALQGTWAPQVDSKCVGIAVDLGPDWVPDGTIDTPSVTIQQILGFHLSLHSRFGAVTAYQTEVGATSETATSGPCAGKTVWFSLVPHAYTSADAANAWCAANVPPIKECEARYVARPGEQTSIKHRY